jgi:hypothetical protein
MNTIYRNSVRSRINFKPTWWRASGLAIAAIASGCCEEPTRPCLPWAVQGETYSVELVQHFETHTDDFEQPLPYERYRLPEHTCGDGLDIGVGSTLQMRAAEKVTEDDRQACVGGCYYLRADAKIDGVVRNAGSGASRGVGPYDFSDQFEAMIGGACTGVYTIGIATVEPSFIAEADQPALTDHVLFRELIGVRPDIAACDAPGSELAKEGSCWDTWFVRIRDASGKLITKDLEAAEAGGGDGGT